MNLEARNLHFAYGSLPVLRGVDLQVGPGITAVIGPNAAGKSTLLRCLCGLLTPAGQVLLDGDDVRAIGRERLARSISYLPQDLSCHAVLTVFEAVLLGRLHQLTWHVAPDDVGVVEQLLAEVGVADLCNRSITQLSGGQAQMVAIAQALAREPAIMLMDEPTSNLDMQHQFEICGLMRRLAADRGLRVVMALHDLNVAARFADTVCVLCDGRMHAAGPPADVLTEEMIAEVYRVRARVDRDGDNRPLVTPLELATADPATVG